MVKNIKSEQTVVFNSTDKDAKIIAFPPCLLSSLWFWRVQSLVTNFTHNSKSICNWYFLLMDQHMDQENITQFSVFETIVSNTHLKKTF